MSARKVVIKAILLSLLTVAMTGGSTAVAQKAKGKKRTVGDILNSIESNTKKVKFTKKKAAALPAFKKTKDLVGKSAQTPSLAQIKPPRRSNLYFEEGTDEGQLEKVTDQGINQLYKLTQQFKESKRRGELWIRLAELYVEKARLIEYRIQQKYDDDIKKFQTGKTKVKPKLDLNAAYEYNKKSIQLYEWFLRDFPKHPKIDQALFFLGYNHFELNDPDKGKDFYERLTKEYPKSPFVEESNFALAEYYFEREKWAEALKYYDVIAQNKRARLFSFALYKKAWCQYKTGAIKDALISLEKVIRAGRVAKGSQDSSAGGVSRIRLASEAMKDLVVFYAEVGTARNARGYFEDIAGEKQTFPLLERLGYYYVDIGNRDGAREIFHSLIAERPNAPKAYDYQYQIVTLYVSTDKNEIFRQELFNWINTYAPESEWARANARDTELVAKAHQLIETTLRNHILQQHQTAQNSRVPSAQKTAKQGYELYFDTFKQGAKLDEMHFFYAELLFEMNEYENASTHYTWVTDNASNSPYFEKASLNSVLALEKGLPKEDQLKKQVGESVESAPFSKTVLAFETAADKYINAFPKGENVPAIRYKLGALYYYHNQFDKALSAFNSIIKDYPKSPYAQYSANLTLDIYNLRKDYVGLEKAGQDILENEDLAKSQVGEQVKGVLQRANFKKAQDLEAKKDYAGAAQAYEEFAKKNAGGELGASAAFNSAINYERAGEPAKAMGMYGIVIATKGNDGLKKNATRFVAPLYEKTGQYQKAAEAFEAYAQKHPKEKESIAFYYNAAVIRDGMNSYNAALTNYQKYFDSSKSADRWETVFLMAKLWERRGNITKAQDYYKQYYDARPRNAAGLIEAAYMVAKIHAKKNRQAEAEEWYKKVIYQQKKLSTAAAPIGVSFAAEAKYIFVAKIFDELRSIRIPTNPANQGKAVQDKLALLNRLKEQLKEVIRYDDSYMIVNSLALIGQAYQHMAAAIYAVPTPKGLDAEGTKQYKAGVDKIAQPFQEEAVKNYESAIERGFSLEGYNDGLKKAQTELNRIKPERFPDHGERAIVTKLPDTLGVESDSDLGPSYKSKDERILIESVAKILGKDENNLKALNALASFYYTQGKYGISRILTLRAQKAHPEEEALHNNLGVIYLSEDKQRAAIASFRKALDLKKDYSLGCANLGSIYVEYRDYARATELLKEGYSHVKSDLRHGVGVEVANNYGLALAGTDDPKRARSIFENILKADNQNVTALLNYTILLVHRLNEKKDGEKALNRLKFLAEDAQTKRRIDDLEKALNEN